MTHEELQEGIVVLLRDAGKPLPLVKIADRLGLARRVAAEALTELRHAGRVQLVATRALLKYRLTVNKEDRP